MAAGRDDLHRRYPQWPHPPRRSRRQHLHPRRQRGSTATTATISPAPASSSSSRRTSGSVRTAIVYFADTGNAVIRRINSTTGVVSIVAGIGGQGGFGGDSGPATAAVLNGPEDLTFGPDGSMYIADTQNNRVRRVAPDGTITTVAGAGGAGETGTVARPLRPCSGASRRIRGRRRHPLHRRHGEQPHPGGRGRRSLSPT
ncbi:MAG: hypothetical protein WKG07_35795 [Hymenobacter sp.]